MTTPVGPGRERESDRETEREHDRLQVLLGGFVLGGLDADEHQAFTRHLRRCAVCQRESAQLSGLPALLDVVDPERVEALEPGSGMPADGTASPVATVVPAGLIDRMRADRRRRRWRYGLAAAVLALVAGALGAGVGPLLDRLDAPPTRPLVATAAPAATGPDGTAAAVEIDLVTRTWGTQLDVRGSSLPSGQVLYLSVTDRQGHAYDVASWTGTPTGRATLTAACWMKPADIAEVRVHTRAGATIATATA